MTADDDRAREIAAMTWLQKADRALRLLHEIRDLLITCSQCLLGLRNERR